MIRVTFLVMALLVCTPAFADQSAEFDLSDREIIDAYNEAQISSVDPLTFRQGHSKGNIYRIYDLPPIFTLTFWYNKESGKPDAMVIHGKQLRPTKEQLNTAVDQLVEFTKIVNHCSREQAKLCLKDMPARQLEDGEKIELNGCSVWMEYSKKDGAPMMSYVPRPQQAPASEKPKKAASGSLPHYDIKAYCKEVADISGGSAMIERECRKMEKAALDELQKMSVPVKTLRYCDEVASVGGKGSYSTLQGCIEMELRAAEDL